MNGHSVTLQKLSVSKSGPTRDLESESGVELLTHGARKLVGVLPKEPSRGLASVQDRRVMVVLVGGPVMVPLRGVRVMVCVPGVSDVI
jgi:hypothetical protein